ncbi:hypothetical protein [Streptomyces mirabilis]|uniref:hypothetical protein n=1 Tax=Streptomyces mirabilis TaxID=68239 RepID=UPI00369169B8
MVSCQESHGKYELDDELVRFLRLIRWSNEAEWVCPVTTVTALLDLAAELWSAEMTGLMPPSFKEKVDRASGGSGQGEYLSTLAGVVRAADQGVSAELAELPLSQWELEVHFRRLRGFYAIWEDPGEYDTFEESVAAAIDSEHPFCAEYLGPLSAEAQRALVIHLQSPEAATDTARITPWANAEELTRLLSIINDHMRDAHRLDRP